MNPLARYIQEHLSVLVTGSGFDYFEESDGFTLSAYFQAGVINLDKLIIRYVQNNGEIIFLKGIGNYRIPSNRVISLTIDPKKREFEGIPLHLVDKVNANVLIKERSRFLFSLPIELKYSMFGVESEQNLPVNKVVFEATIKVKIKKNDYSVIIDTIFALIDLAHEYVKELKDFLEPKTTLYCWRCGSKQEDDNKFCTICGVKLK